MIGIENRMIASGINFKGIRDSKFKTLRLSVHFMLPVQKDQVAANGLLAFLLTRASREYPDFTKLAQRLAELYGASLNADVSKLGDVQVLSISATGLSDRLTLNGEKISEALANLLCSVLFNPLLENGQFPRESFLQEQRQTLEMLDAEYNDKRIYAKQRCEELMCAEEPYGVGRCGTKEQIAALSREDLLPAWKRLVETARIEVMAMGDCNTTKIYELFCQAVAGLVRGEVRHCTTENVAAARTVKNEVESMDVAQSKLVMGFRTGIAIPDSRLSAAKLMCTIFGGTPHSKLFLNVREKLSLCYYCSSQLNSMKGIMLVQSGVETKNIERAKEEILAQLQQMKDGDFSEDDIIAAKKSLCNSYKTLADSLGGLESWYLSQTFASTVRSPEESAAEINAVTKEEIVEAARLVSLDTVYSLIGKEGSAQ